MHILAGSIIVSPPFFGLHGHSLIDMNPPYVSQGPMVSYVVSGNPQKGPSQSIGAPYSQY